MLFPSSPFWGITCIPWSRSLGRSKTKKAPETQFPNCTGTQMLAQWAVEDTWRTISCQFISLEYSHFELFRVCSIRPGAFRLSALWIFLVQITALGQLIVLVIESCECRYFPAVAKWEKICGDVEQNLVLVSLPLKLFCGRAEGSVSPTKAVRCAAVWWWFWSVQNYGT